MTDLPFDAQERLALCGLLEELGPEAPTLIEGWTAKDLAAHLVLRDRDPVAGPCLVLPGPFQGIAERRRATLAQRNSFEGLVGRIRSGPPPGFFRLGWVRSVPSLNEYFVHHEDLRRANGLGPRDTLTPALDVALWGNVLLAGGYLSRRVHGAGLEVAWAGTEKMHTVRRREPHARLSGAPGEILLYLFGRARAAETTLTGSREAVGVIERTHFGM